MPLLNHLSIYPQKHIHATALYAHMYRSSTHTQTNKWLKQSTNKAMASQLCIYRRKQGQNKKPGAVTIKTEENQQQQQYTVSDERKKWQMKCDACSREPANVRRCPCLCANSVFHMAFLCFFSNGAILFLA